MITPSEFPEAMNHVFVDFENGQAVDLTILGRKTISLTLLLGARQSKLDTALVEKLMEHADSVQLIRLTASGRNALDFALAYYVGRAVNADPGGSFHIISKDTGYDALIEHLRSRQVQIRRHADFSRLSAPAPAKTPLPAIAATSSKAPAPSPQEDLLARVMKQFGKNSASRPKRQKSLSSYLRSFTGKTAVASEVTGLIEELKAGGYISIDAKGAVSYRI